MSIADNIFHFQKLIPEDVKMVAVSKFHPSEMILQAYNAGQRYFGESRVKEFLDKERVLPKDIKWHFIGHLQTNKVKPIIGKVAMIESVDSERLIDLIDKESLKAGVTTNVLLQVHIAQEETKFGFSPEELKDFFKGRSYREMKATKICGLMGMATNTEDETRIRSDFRNLHSLYLEIKDTPELELPYFKYLSMGMSGDWPIAMEEGANIVRIGSAIFGQRDYT